MCSAAFYLAKGPGRILVADVGWGLSEEYNLIDQVPLGVWLGLRPAATQLSQPGQNFGWPCWEGHHRTAYQDATPDKTGVAPGTNASLSCSWVYDNVRTSTPGVCAGQAHQPACSLWNRSVRAA